MLSPTINAGTFNGLTLKAWAQVKTDGTLVKSSNVTSVTKGGTGAYQLNFTTAMATTTYMAKVQYMPRAFAAGDGLYFSGANTTAALGYITLAGGAPADTNHYVEVWE